MDHEPQGQQSESQDVPGHGHNLQLLPIEHTTKGESLTLPTISHLPTCASVYALRPRRPSAKALTANTSGK